METSLRYCADSKALRIHAKQTFPIHSNTQFQLHGELDTKFGRPCYYSAWIRYLHADLSATLGVGLLYDTYDKFWYSVRGKKTFPVTNDGSLSFNIKGRSDVDRGFKGRKSRGATEFSWSIFSFQKDQDVRLRVGYEVLEQVPYVQIRENNWAINVDHKGRWNVRFDL